MTLFLLGLWACTGEPDTGDTDTPAPLPNPTVTITEPTAGLEVSGMALQVVVSLTDFELTGKDELAWLPPLGPLGLWATARAHEPGEEPNGYIAYQIDGLLQAETIETTVSLSLIGLSFGPHTLSVDLHYPDGDGFYPPALAEVVFQLIPE